MRRTPPAYDPFEDRDDPAHEAPPNVRRISTTPGYDQRPARRADVRPLHAARRPLPRRGPDPRVWFVRGSIGVAALAGLWLGLQAMFPVAESQVTQTPPAVPTAPVDSVAVGAPEPPAVQAAAPAAQPPATSASQQAAPAEGDRLPGLPTQTAAQQAAAAQPAPAAAPTQAAAPVQPAAAPAQPTAAPQPEARKENPSQQPVGKPTLAPIPPPPGGQQATTPAQQAAQQAANQQAAAAPKPPAPPAAQSTGGPFELSASASPVNPISEQAIVTITVRATQNGAPLAGASCMASIYFRTNTIKQPDGGFRTNANGVGSFTLDAKGSTYGHYIPVDVTCSGRGGAVTARTGFTPVRGR